MKSIWNYSNNLPDVQHSCRISIGEGQTPLVKSRYLGARLGINNLYFKLENLNPTGSYKDRFAAVFVSSLLQSKATFCIATSSGNTGAALAAYCGAAGIDCYLVVVDGAPLQKIHQMQLYGGKVVMVKKFGLDAQITKQTFSLLKELTGKKNMALPISAYCFCPVGMQGVETIALEILDELNGKAHHIFSPSGGGGLTLSVAKAVLNDHNHSSRCKVHCVQPVGNNTIAGALRKGELEARELESSATHVSGLQVPGILDGTNTLLLCRETGGTGYIVEDNDVYNTQALMARHEGIFCEPAGAVSVTALATAVANKEINADDNVVCLVTGSGFKDMSNAVHQFQLPVMQQYQDIDNLSKFLSTL